MRKYQMSNNIFPLDEQEKMDVNSQEFERCHKKAMRMNAKLDAKLDKAMNDIKHQNSTESNNCENIYPNVYLKENIFSPKVCRMMKKRRVEETLKDIQKYSKLHVVGKCE
jgi:hypothetical protein